ncbi:MAG: polysaccharide pyruvyl transferase family protein [Clostridia bacterium]|nr:polysaccharide pyruvyl transferase family protein [Clostridia bacterium]
MATESKKRIGILSMQRIKNYGSFLQAYALKTMIEELGHEVEFVDYRVGKPLIEEQNKGGKLSKVTTILKGDAPLIQKIQYINHKRNFSKKYFSKLNLTEYQNYTPELDVLVIGSDEVFNCIQKNKNVGYSLELFGKDNRAKKVITYAASFGNTTTNKLKSYKKYKEIGELLSKIDTISVRDKNSGNVVAELTDKDVVYNLDPVLVFNYPNREDLIPTIDVKEKYMIVYAYNNRISKEESKWIKDYAKKNGLKVYAIGGAQSCADKFIDCSPFGVLAYFKNAECVITDTFHGSIFSIIMQKNFVTLVRKSVGNEYGNEEKLTDLLERVNLKDRMLYDIREMPNVILQNIDYEKVNKILNVERENTLKYLNNEL